MMHPHISLDIETLSTHKNAVVASIGACRVDANGIVEHAESDFYVRLDIQGQMDCGRHVSADTLQFWMGQERHVQAETFQGAVVQPSEALRELRLWISKSKIEGVWTKGPAFDGAILESLAEEYGVLPAWNFREHRDIRTLDTIIRAANDAALENAWYEAQLECSVGMDVAHNALEDAKAQGRLLHWFLREIRS